MDFAFENIPRPPQDWDQLGVRCQSKDLNGSFQNILKQLDKTLDDHIKGLVRSQLTRSRFCKSTIKSFAEYLGLKAHVLEFSFFLKS